MDVCSASKNSTNARVPASHLSVLCNGNTSSKHHPRRHHRQAHGSRQRAKPISSRLECQNDSNHDDDGLLTQGEIGGETVTAVYIFFV
mmetsp:Transcript_10142/g.28917  ORF Transcript_10142/g.28917 Transcript_10142/m.28917 type:complete len:88 (+) Transcript_10142:673-936(+)